MALRVHLLCPKRLPQSIKFQPHPFPSTFLLKNPSKKTQISCTPNISDADLASDLTTVAEKINTHLAQKKEAMEKSKQLLFTELSHYLGLKTEEVKKKWKKMNEDEKWVLVKEFVLEWGVNFHPLSARSVKEMVDEYLVEEKPP